MRKLLDGTYTGVSGFLYPIRNDSVKSRIHFVLTGVKNRTYQAISGVRICLASPERDRVKRSYADDPASRRERKPFYVAQADPQSRKRSWTDSDSYTAEVLEGSPRAGDQFGGQIGQIRPVRGGRAGAFGHDTAVVEER